jgi:hypothetical protein
MKPKQSIARKRRHTVNDTNRKFPTGHATLEYIRP